MSLFLTTLLIFLGVIFVFLLIQWKKQRKLYNTLTGETMLTVPIWDLPVYFLSNAKTSYEREWLYQQIKDQDIYMTWLGPRSVVVVAHNKLAAEMLSDGERFTKTDNSQSKTMTRYFGQRNVSRVSGHAWKVQRKSMNPAFQDLEIYQEIFAEKAISVIKSMEITDCGVVHNINEFMQKMTLDVLGKTIFDHDFKSIEGSTAKDLQAYNHIIENVVSLSMIFLAPLLEKFPETPMIKKINESVDVMKALFSNLVKEAKVKLESNSQAKKRSMLEYLVQANLSTDEDEHMNEEDLLGNVAVFFLAGHETTATALSFSITLLAKNPDIQDKLRREILADIPGQMTKENLAKSEYLNAFIKESMRLYPPVSIVPTRICAKDTHLGDWNIPKDTHLAFNIYAIHMSKESYGDPENFRPERWLPSEQAKRKIPNSAWIPFSSGPRICIGNNFSLYEQRVFLVELLKNYRLLANDKSPLLPQKGAFLTPPQKCDIQFIKF